MDGTLQQPGLQTEHPITIVSDPDASNSIPEDFIIDVGGISKKTRRCNLAYKLSWDEVSRAVQGTAVSYTLHGSVSPFRRDNVLQTGIIGTEVIFNPPIFIETLSYYFWISAVFDDGSEEFISETPATLENSTHKTAFADGSISFSEKLLPDTCGWNDELENVIEYIREGNLLQLQSTGEKALLFLRRHGEDRPFGVPCACNDSFLADADPDYEGAGRCTMCFGTGIYGGFYPSIPILIRYEAMPTKDFDPDVRGYTLDHAFTSYMLWEPVVRNGDLIVRLQDGSRYEITSRSESSDRGIRLHQDADLRQVMRTDILMQVTDEKINKALEGAEKAGFVRDGFLAFG